MNNTLLKKVWFSAGIIFMGTLIGYAQPPIEWEKCYGGSSHETAKCIEQTHDGGYIVAGNTESTDGDVSSNDGIVDCWVLKISSDGAIEWEITLGGGSYELAERIKQTQDGGYIVVGQTRSMDGDVSEMHGVADYWVVKLDALGNIQWEKSYGGTNFDVGNAVQQTNDGGYVITGYCGSSDVHVSDSRGSLDYWIVKITDVGDIEWEKSLGGSGIDEAYSIMQTTDNGYIVAGRTNSVDGDVTDNNGHFDFWVVKLNSSGTIEWEKSYGGINWQWAQDVQQTSEGGYIVVGNYIHDDAEFEGDFGESDYWVLKLSGTGDIEWDKTFGGSGADVAYSVDQTMDGGYIVAGTTESSDGDVTGFNGDVDGWVLKLTNAGDLEWEKTLGGSNKDIPDYVRQTSDGGYIVAAMTRSSDGDISSKHAYSDFWVVKFSAPPSSIINEVVITDKLTAFPNPTERMITIESSNELIGKEYLIYNSFGKKVLSGIITSERTLIDATNLAEGAYEIIVHNAGQVHKFRFVKS